jgi:3-dehydroquinate synthase
MALTRIAVELATRRPSRSYTVFVDPDAGAESRLAAELGRRAPNVRIALLTDTRVDALHRPRFERALRAAGFSPLVKCVAVGEAAKSLGVVEQICESWIDAGLDRSSVVLTLGGGVVGDLGGLCAALFMRGIRYVQVPTTLLSQVDSSVGGKTAVNLPQGKNLVGAFHQPLFVWADVSALATLPARERISGLAEVVKHGLIADEELFLLIEERAEAARAGDLALLAELVARSCAVKAAVVGADEEERSPLVDGGDGGRAKLNYGHTIGHALELESAGRLRHGEAVALGMLAAARVGAALGLGEAGLEGRLENLLNRLGLPTDLDRRLGRTVLERAMHDKKRTGQKVAFVLLSRIGAAELRLLDRDHLTAVLQGSKSG